MREHHKQSIENLINYFKADADVISVVLGGSLAKGTERPDSDIDAIVVVTEGKAAALERENRLCETIKGHCTYEKGYFDIKYATIGYLEELTLRGSEPSRNAFVSSRCLYGNNPRVNELIKLIPVFQKHEKHEKMLSFYCSMDLYGGYFWKMSENNPYLRIKAASDTVLYGLRLVLQDQEVLFPCHKALTETVSRLERKPDGILDKAARFLNELTEETKDDFKRSVLGFIDFTPPYKRPEVLTRFIDDHELWWYKQRPNIAEW
jgi:hypothetical protein